MVMKPRLEFVAPLFVPGHRPERFAKAAASGADAIIIDLEDAVPVEAKEVARANVRVDFTELPVLVRINGAGTAWHADDLAAIASVPVAAVVLPKAEPGPELGAACAGAGHCVVALVETVHGLVGARTTATIPGVARLAFGSIDFCADLGCAHTRDALLAARSELVLASRLSGLPAAVDGVTAAINDPALARDDARYARDLGFGGKLCIHPQQVGAVLVGFQP